MLLSSYILDVVGPPMVKRLAVGSRHGVERELRYLAASSLGARPLNELTKGVCWHWWSEHTGRGFPTAANRQRKYLRQVLALAIDHDLIEKDPSSRLKRMKEPKHRRRWLTPEQRTAILEDAARTNPRIFRYIWLAMNSIVRRGSLMHVEKRDIDLVSGTITYRHMKNRPDGIQVPLVPVCLDVVKAWLAEPGPLLFDYWAPQAVTQAFRRIKNRVGVTGPGAPGGDFHFHDLRHDGVRRLIQAGVDHLVIRDLGGWTTLSMVALYSNTPDETKAEAMLKGFQGA